MRNVRFLQCAVHERRMKMGDRKIIERGSSDCSEIDNGVKNAWRWEWMETTIEGIPLSSCIRKLNQNGKATCIWCNTDVKYGSAGKKAIIKHVTRETHQKFVKDRKNNTRLPGKNISFTIRESQDR